MICIAKDRVNRVVTEKVSHPFKPRVSYGDIDVSLTFDSVGETLCVK